MVGLQDFIDYFLSPSKTGYDVPKTLTYAIIFIIAAYLIYKLLKKMKVKIDKKLATAILPYIIFGGILRVLRDAGILTSSLFITPGIYFFVAVILITIILFSLLIEKKKNIPYFKISFILGLILVSFSLPFIEPVNFESSAIILIFFLPWVIPFSLVKWREENKVVSLIHLFDANTTFVAMNFFGYAEQHVLPTFLIETFSPISFIFVKLIAIVTILILIDKFCEDKEFGKYLKLIIGILGAGTGTRDFIRLLALV
jgi:uncharacterized membrane protein